MSVDYYECLGLTKKASHDEVKQAYRKLALKHHPDKNQDKQKAKVIFTQITEAYTVLNDPQKRQNYDKYGVRESQFAEFQEFQQFQQFMGDFGLFQEFLDDFLSFDDLATMEKMFGNMMKGSNSRKKGGSRRKRGGSGMPSQREMREMEKMYDQMLKETLKGFDMDLGDLNDQEEEQDEEQLSEDELLMIEFGKLNSDKKKSGKKRRLVCRFDGQKFEDDEILIHFGENHTKEFEAWKQSRNQKKDEKKQEQKESKTNGA